MIKKLKLNITAGFKNRKINVFFLFLILSIIILIFSKLSKVYTNTVVFNINKVNVPKEYVILNDSSEKLNITLKTHGFNWLKYYFSKPKIAIDFERDVVKKNALYVWDKFEAYINIEKQFGNQVELLNISPDKIYFKYDVNLIKKVPVILNADINFSTGYDIFNAFVIKPDSIVVIGPNAIVEKINSVKTKKIVLDNVKSNILTPVKLNLPKNNNDIIYSDKQVSLMATVEKFTEGTLKVPINVINIPENLSIKYFPKFINVIYYTSLNNFNSITAKDFQVICDFKKVDDNQTFLLPELIKITDKVKTARIRKSRIEFIIEK